ncbi:bifunctional AP-4-A phosphorylase/ADP sulfurylase [Ceratobasidium sp. 414]|nr:bifunctional AP-4-A phosphorylase/ADP sulfurylase [Ceratobasidium sp. 414]
MGVLKHSEIISVIPAQFEKAKASGALMFFPSTIHRTPEQGLSFEISTCPALQNKPTLPAPDFVKHDKPDPFAPPYVTDLYVGELKDELDGDEYVILVHFEPQDSPLTPPDLTQAYLLIRAARKSSRPVFAFYNCGKDSGASQPHKHIQLIPTKEDGESDDNEEGDEDEDRRPPAEGLIARLKIEDETKTFTLPLPYVHLVQKLDLPKATVSGGKPLSEKALEELSQRLTDTFLKLLDEALQAIRLHASTESSEAAARTGKAVAPSYNVLLTSEHMHLIPRRREQTVDELHPIHLETTTTEADTAYTPQRLSVNALGFAGMLLAKSDAEMRAIKARGVIDLLTQVGVPRVEQKDEMEGTLA